MGKDQICNSEIGKKRIVPRSLFHIRLQAEQLKETYVTSLFESTDFDFCLCVGSSPY